MDFHNESAQKFLDSQSEIAIKNGKFWTKEEGQRQRLVEFLGERKFKVGNLLLNLGENSLLILQAERLISEGSITFGVTLYIPLSSQFERLSGLVDYFGLTRSEARVAYALVLGNTGREVAKIVGCSFETVRSHKKNIYRKLSISSKFELLRLAYLFNEVY